MKLVGDSVPDQEALTALENSGSEFIPSQSRDLSNKHKVTLQTIAVLRKTYAAFFIRGKGSTTIIR